MLENTSINHLNLEQRIGLKLLNAGLRVYSDVYILVEGRITIVAQEADAAAITGDKNNKEVVFKNNVLFTSWKSKINNEEEDNVEGLDFAMPMYNSLENSDNYVKTSAGLWQYFRDEPDDNIIDPKSLKFTYNYR